MYTPNDVVTGRIVDYDPQRETLVIHAHYPNYNVMIRREYKECNVQLVDSRRMSDKQRKACYALLNEIAEWSGSSLSTIKEHMKLRFLADDLQLTGDKIFSLSNASMSLVAAFQRHLVRFIIDYDVPCKEPLVNLVDDIDDYLYACLAAKKCAVCGMHADLHHIDRVGMGRNRRTIVHEGMEVVSLCRLHHTEAHQYTAEKWQKMYHFDRGIKLDKPLCKIYRLKENEELLSEKVFEEEKSNEL